MVSKFEVSYDDQAEAAYVHVAAGTIETTEEIIEDRAWMDLDADGNLLGIELVGIEADDLPNVLASVDEALAAVKETLSEERRELLALS